MSAVLNFVATPLAIPDVLLVTMRKFADRRGHFMETYSRQNFSRLGIDCDFVQDNQSTSAKRGTVRGLHFQNPPAPQAKLVRVLKGSIFDVAVDIRRGSPTFGRWCSTVVTAEAGEQVFIPRGFAHAFCTLEADTAVAYKVDGYYAPDCESGIIWNDPDIAIDWPVAADDVLLSEKDAVLPRLVDVQSPFPYRDRG
jgi:dTDP-4-dehydrorhamnose 3,5-epimerase